MSKVSKKLVEVRKKVEFQKLYSLNEAIKLAQETSYTKFDGSLDLVFNLNLDVKQANQQLRGSAPLPNGSGKIIKILVATDDIEQQKSSKNVGADIVVGTIELIEILKSEKFNFDVIVTNPKMMPTLSKFGKILGPKNLMPNPKTGTITSNLPKTVEAIKKGKITNYRTDKEGNVHVLIGKVSMDAKLLVENAQSIIDTIIKLKPSVVKGKYLKSLAISASMGPSVKIVVEK